MIFQGIGQTAVVVEVLVVDVPGVRSMVEGMVMREGAGVKLLRAGHPRKVPADTI